jgi:serine/threonine protein kinase
MAPESLKHFSYSKKSDMWSFGILLIEIWTQQAPYPDYSIVDVGAKVSQGTLVPSLPTLAPSDWRDIVNRCCQNDPNERASWSQILFTEN